MTFLVVVSRPAAGQKNLGNKVFNTDTHRRSNASLTRKEGHCIGSFVFQTAVGFSAIA